MGRLYPPRIRRLNTLVIVGKLCMRQYQLSKEWKLCTCSDSASWPLRGHGWRCLSRRGCWKESLIRNVFLIPRPKFQEVGPIAFANEANIARQALASVLPASPVSCTLWLWLVIFQDTQRLCTESPQDNVEMPVHHITWPNHSRSKLVFFDQAIEKIYVKIYIFI